MLEREATTKDDLKKSIISLAIAQRIMTPYTALLVLETEQDYARFHIDRKSLTDVLAVQDGAVKRVHRTSITFPKGFTPTLDERGRGLDGDGDEDRDGVAEFTTHDQKPSEKAEAKKVAPRSAPKTEDATIRVRPGPVRSDDRRSAGASRASGAASAGAASPRLGALARRLGSLGGSGLERGASRRRKHQSVERERRDERVGSSAFGRRRERAGRCPRRLRRRCGRRHPVGQASLRGQARRRHG
jgi:hypothetical protein